MCAFNYLRFVEIWYRRILTYFKWRDLSWSYIASLDTRKYIQIRLSRYNSQLDLGLIRTSWHGPRFEQLMYMHIRLYTLRYVRPELMCSLVMGYDGDGDSFHDQDATEWHDWVTWLSVTCSVRCNAIWYDENE